VKILDNRKILYGVIIIASIISIPVSNYFYMGLQNTSENIKEIDYNVSHTYIHNLTVTRSYYFYSSIAQVNATLIGLFFVALSIFLAKGYTRRPPRNIRILHGATTTGLLFTIIFCLLFMATIEEDKIYLQMKYIFYQESIALISFIFLTFCYYADVISNKFNENKSREIFIINRSTKIKIPFKINKK